MCEICPQPDEILEKAGAWDDLIGDDSVLTGICKDCGKQWAAHGEPGIRSAVRLAREHIEATGHLVALDMEA